MSGIEEIVPSSVTLTFSPVIVILDELIGSKRFSHAPNQHCSQIEKTFFKAPEYSGAFLF
jgi:hypothetical protein